MRKKKTFLYGALYGLAVFAFAVFALGPILWSFVMSITPQTELVGNTTLLIIIENCWLMQTSRGNCSETACSTP